jgi:hypothetical protein
MTRIPFSEHQISSNARFLIRSVISMVVLLIVVTINLPAQKAIPSTDVPANVLENFKKEYASATNVQWFRSKKDKGYNTTCQLNGKKTRLRLDDQGNTLKKVTHLQPNELPAPVTQSVQSNFKDYQLKHGVEIQHMKKKQTFYRVRLMKGQKKAEVRLIFFGPDGKILTDTDQRIEPEDKEEDGDQK